MSVVNGKNNNVMVIIAILGSVGGLGVYSQGGDELIKQSLIFMKEDITGLDDKLQQEQRLLIDTVDEKVSSLDRLLQTEIKSVDHELTTVHEDLHDLEIKHRDDRILYEKRIIELEKQVASLLEGTENNG